MKKIIWFVIVCLGLYTAFLTFKINELNDLLKSNSSSIQVENKTVSGFSTDITSSISKVSEQIVFIDVTLSDYSHVYGSGIVFSSTADGLAIVTNYHLIEGAINVEVTLASQDKIQATFLNGDKLTDVAVLMINPEVNVNPIVHGSTSTLKLGEWIIALGNSVEDSFVNTVSVGVISGINHVYKALKDDAKVLVHYGEVNIDEGNTGGPIVNMDGQMIGMSSTNLSLEGKSGVIIPIEEIEEIVRMIIENQVVIRPEIKVTTKNVSDFTTYQKSNQSLSLDLITGLYVETVERDSEAELSQIKVGDVIYKINGETVTDYQHFRKILQSKEIGDTVELTLIRDMAEVSVSVVLE